MKGLVERSDSGTVFLSVKFGSLVQESKTARAGFEPIEVKNPRTNETFTKFIKRYSGVEALINEIEWKDTGDKYDTQFMSWRIHLDADGTPCVLELPFQSRQSTRFMKLAENINFDEPVEFRAWHDAKEDKTAFFIGQNGEAIRQKYTRDNPGDCPEPTKNRMGKWNYDAQTEFLHDQMMNVVLPKVEAAKAKRTFEAPKTTPTSGDGLPSSYATEPAYLDDEDGSAAF